MNSWHIYVYTYIYIYTHTKYVHTYVKYIIYTYITHIYFFHISVCWQSNNTPVATTTSAAQSLVSKCYSLLKEPGFLEEMTASRAEAGKVQGEPEIFCCVQEISNNDAECQNNNIGPKLEEFLLVKSGTF